MNPSSMDHPTAFLLGVISTLLLLLVGVQLARAPQPSEEPPPTAPAFADTSCEEELGTLRLRVTATAYNSEPAQTDDSPWITASGTRTRVGTLAVSRDLLELLPYGSTLFVVEDTMHQRWRRRVDFWMPDRGSALRFGVRQMRLELR